MIDQEAKDIAASVEHLLTQRGTDARNWEAQSKQWEGECKEQRAELDTLRADIAAVCIDRDRALALCADLTQQFAEAQEAAGIARVEIGREWKNVLTWLIEDTRERLTGVADPNVTFYQGKLSVLTYLLTLANDDLGLERAGAREGA